MNGIDLNKMKRHLVVGLSFVGLLLSAGVHAASMIIVQPISVCNDIGTDCANPSGQFFETETDKIWDQAGVDISFLPMTSINASSFQHITGETEFNTLANGAGNGQNDTPTVINMWFVDQIGAGDVAGLAFLSSPGNARNGVAIANKVFTDADGAGRRDTLAHEIGHNLGLDHTLESNLRLMAPGSIRLIPTSPLNITPDGVGVSQLTGAEISTALASPFVVAVPEPVSVAVMALMACGFVTARRIRSPKSVA